MLEPGTLLGERYRLIAQVASGGMGIVWRAHDESLRRTVAIKILRPELVTNPASRERLAFEARAVASIDAPNVVRIYDVGNLSDLSPDGLPYLVMEFVDGAPLSTLLNAGGTLPTQRTATLLRDVSQGLAAAHGEGLVHRDIKPGNILVTAEGTAKVTDFGIAHGPVSADLTLTGTLVGTAKYLAPEQVEGLAATSASDVYALGIVAYECLAGVPPFVADTDVATALMRLRIDPPPLPPTVPARLSVLIALMLSLQPEHRPTLEDVISEASSIAAGGSEHTRVLDTRIDQPEADQASGKRSRNRRFVVLLSLVAAGVLAAVGSLTLIGSGESTHHPNRPTAPVSIPATAAAPVTAPAAARSTSGTPSTSTPTQTSSSSLSRPTSSSTASTSPIASVPQSSTATKPPGKPTTKPGKGHPTHK
jgi:serine/threonine protein kinase